MPNLLLTDEERNRFAEWLEREASTDKIFIEQSAKLGPHGAIMVKKFTAEMHAALIIAAKLRSIESFSIGSEHADEI